MNKGYSYAEKIIKNKDVTESEYGNVINTITSYTADKNYKNGCGVDPVGGVESIISHYLSKELFVPCVHAPAFKDYQIKSFSYQ